MVDRAAEGEKNKLTGADGKCVAPRPPRATGASGTLNAMLDLGSRTTTVAGSPAAEDGGGQRDTGYVHEYEHGETLQIDLPAGTGLPAAAQSLRHGPWPTSLPVTLVRPFVEGLMERHGRCA